MQNQTRQQRRAAARNADSPWKAVKVSPSARDMNRARYRTTKLEKAAYANWSAAQPANAPALTFRGWKKLVEAEAEAAQKASQILPSLSAVS